MNTSITQITNRIGSLNQDTIVIGLMGGSASGKSYTSNQLSAWAVAHGYDVVTLHQDDFALGRLWDRRHTSPYRWDDPDNYRLDEAYNILMQFLKGDKLSFLAYSLKAHEPSIEKTLSWHYANQPTGQRLVIVEGLFAWRAPFDRLIDLRVFLDVDFWHRYVLRLQRNVVDAKVTDFQKVTEQYFSFVSRAYSELLEPEKAKADLIIENKINLKTIAAQPLTDKASVVRKIFQDDSISVTIDKYKVVRVTNANGLLFREQVTDDIATAMLSTPTKL